MSMTGSAFLDTLFGSRHHMTFRSIVTVLGCLAIPAVVQGQGQAPQAQPLGGPAGARREVTITAIPGVVAAGAR